MNIFHYISQFFEDLFLIVNDMSPYLLLGLLFAGILKVFLPEQFIAKYLRNKNIASVVNATILGIPLPLCSCGVLPTGISLYKSGASKGATNAFLTATPQTGVDSILVTYAMLGLPMAIIRPIVAIFSGILSGMITNKFTEKDSNKGISITNEKEACNNITNESFIKRLWLVCKYAFYTFLSNIAKSLIVGLLIASVISVFLPNEFFTNYIPLGVVGILLILVASMPLYICATASVPVAAILLSKGISPGAILVFLMAGPATNAASFTLIGSSLGKRSLFAYLLTIVTTSIIFGILIDAFFPIEWFQITDIASTHIHGGMGMIFWFKTICSIFLVGLILFIYIQKYIQKITPMKIKSNMQLYKVHGMSCNHCKNLVERTFIALDNVKKAEVNLAKGVLEISGDIKEDKVERLIKELGFIFKGKTKL